MRPRYCGQPVMVTQGYHPLVDSMAINAEPRRREHCYSGGKTLSTNKLDTGVVVDIYISGTTMGWRDGLFFLTVIYFVVVRYYYQAAEDASSRWLTPCAAFFSYRGYSSCIPVLDRH